MVQLATAGDLIGGADQVNEKGQWIRRFEAQAVSKCVVAMITRQRVRELLSSLDSATLLEVTERMNSAWSGWVQYYATLLGMSFPRAARADAGSARTKIWSAGRRRHRADLRAGAWGAGRNDRMLAPDGEPADGGLDQAGRNRAARTSLHFVKWRRDRRRWYATRLRRRRHRRTFAFRTPAHQGGVGELRSVGRASNPTPSSNFVLCCPFGGMLPKNSAASPRLIWHDHSDFCSRWDSFARSTSLA